MTYTCAQCGGTFDSPVPDAQAQAEADALFPGLAESQREIVCDECFRLFMAHEDLLPGGKFWKQRRNRRQTPD